MAIPSTARLIRSRVVRLGGFVVGAAISERVFRSPGPPPSLPQTLLTLGREEFTAAGWEVGRMNDARLSRVTRRLLLGDRSIGPARSVVGFASRIHLPAAVRRRG